MSRAHAQMSKPEFNTSHRMVPRSRKNSAGVGILEVLVALVVVSIGVLGVAGLQLTGMKHSSGGYNRFRAILFAENMAARMRSNETGVDALSYAGFDSDAGTDCAVIPVPYCQTTQAVAAANCSAAEMANFDLFSIACGNWSAAGEAKNGVKDELANGRLQVDCQMPCSASSNYTVLITWDENTSLDGNEGSVSQKRVQVRFNP